MLGFDSVHHAAKGRTVVLDAWKIISRTYLWIFVVGEGESKASLRSVNREGCSLLPFRKFIKHIYVSFHFRKLKQTDETGFLI